MEGETFEPPFDDPNLHLSECIDVNDILGEVDDWTLRTDVQVIYSSVYALILVVGVIGNGLLISSMILRRRLSVANVFLINLAVSDLLLCITAVPITPVLAFIKRWIFGMVMCKVVPSCQAISVLISSYCLCFIAVDRYRSIVTPMKEPWALRHAQLLMLGTWLGGIFLASPLYFTQTTIPLTLGAGSGNITFCGEFCGEYNWPADERYKLLYGSLLLIVQFLLPATVMSLCYWKILQKVRQDWIVTEGSMLTEAQQAQTAVRKRRVMYVLILMVVVFMASWLPLTAVNMARDMGHNFERQMYFKLLNVHAIAMTSIVWNPLLYFWMSKRHRRALKDDMFWLTNVRRHNNVGVLSRFTPSPSVSFVYKRTLERHLINPNFRAFVKSRELSPQHAMSHSIDFSQNTRGDFSASLPKLPASDITEKFRRGTLADPTCMGRERVLGDMQSNCFLLVPLMPLCQSVHRRNSHLTVNPNNKLVLSPARKKTSNCSSIGDGDATSSLLHSNQTTETKMW